MLHTCYLMLISQQIAGIIYNFTVFLELKILLTFLLTMASGEEMFPKLAMLIKKMVSWKSINPIQCYTVDQVAHMKMYP